MNQINRRDFISLGSMVVPAIALGKDKSFSNAMINKSTKPRIDFRYDGTFYTEAEYALPKLLYIYRMKNETAPKFNKRIFWDVAFEKLDYDAKARFIIERVFDRGDVDDIRNCRRYYGDKKVAEVLLNAKFLSETTMYLASAVIDRPLKDFRCYTLRQSNPGLFPY